MCIQKGQHILCVRVSYFLHSVEDFKYKKGAGSVASVMSGSVTLWTVAHQAPLSMGFCRQNHTSGLPSPSPGYLPYPGIEPKSFMFPAFAVGSLPPAAPRKPIRKVQKGIFWSMMPWEVWNPQIKEYVRKYRKRSTENCHTIRILVFSFHVHHLSQSFKEPNCEA